MAILMSPGQAAAIAVATNSTTLAPDGGRLFGIPVYTGSIDSPIVILDPSQLLIADEGQMDVSMSTEGSLEFDTINERFAGIDAQLDAIEASLEARMKALTDHDD